MTGWLSDHTGRKPLIVAGMLVQAGALGLLVAGSGSFAAAFRGGPARRRHGDGLSDADRRGLGRRRAKPRDRARLVGVYRFWRDSASCSAPLFAGLGADLAGSGPTIAAVAALTAASGLAVAASRWRRETIVLDSSA